MKQPPGKETVAAVSDALAEVRIVQRNGRPHVHLSWTGVEREIVARNGRTQEQEAERERTKLVALRALDRLGVSLEGIAWHCFVGLPPEDFVVAALHRRREIDTARSSPTISDIVDAVSSRLTK